MSISNPPPQSFNKKAFRTAIALTLLFVALSALILFDGGQTGVSEVRYAAIIAAVIAIVCGISAVIIRSSENSTRGGWLMIGSMAFMLPFLSLFLATYIEGVDLVSLIAIPAIIAWTAYQTLPKEVLFWALGVGTASLIAAFTLDNFDVAERVTWDSINGRFLLFAAFIVLGAAVIIFVLRRFNSFRLRTKLLILFLLVALIPLGISTYLTNQSSRIIQIDSASRNLSSIAEQTANVIDSFIFNTQATLEQEAQVTILRNFVNADEATRNAMREDVLSLLSILRSKDSEHIISYALLDRERNTLAIVPLPDNASTESTSQAGTLWIPDEIETGLLTALLTGTSYASPVVFDDQNEPSLYLSENFTDLSGNPSGQIVVRYDASILQELIEANNGIAGLDSFGVLFDENQLHLAHGTAPETLYKTVDQLPTETALTLIERRRLPNWPLEDLSTNLPELSQQLDSREPIFTSTDAATGDRVNQVAIQGISAKPWKVAFFQPQDVFLAAIDEQTKNSVIFLIVIAGILVGISFAATNLIAAPINTLTELVEHISAGNLSIRVPVISKDEIGRLAVAFNKMTGQIRGLLSGLETQVTRRTQELERRAVQLQTAAEVAREASNLQDLDALLDRTVTLIQDRFGYYHAGIFLLDERREYAVLRAANSEGGQAMLKQGHRLQVGQTGLVGFATSMGEPRIAHDVDADQSHFAHAFLPETRSEIALPLIVGENIIGALDVQSVEAYVFDEEDVTVLRVLADQLAVAIENTRLLAEVRQSVFELQSAYGEFTQESWKKWTQQAEGHTGYRYRGTDVEPALERSPEAILALRQGKPITKIAQIPSEDQSALAVPIRLRDQTLGVINLQFDTEEIPPDILNLVENISNRLATSLENARLYEETQRRAAQEQLTSEITARIRESLDIDAVLKTAVQEIGQKLSLHDVTIQLETNGNSTPEKEEA